MPLPRLFHPANPDIGKLAREKDILGLVRLLGHSDPILRDAAADAIKTLGPAVVSSLAVFLRSPESQVRLGAAEALCMIRDPAAAMPLLEQMSREKHEDVKWAIILALGEVGEPQVMNNLVPFLTDKSRYLRYGAALSLSRLGWVPPDEDYRIRHLAALQDWDAVKAAGPASVLPLSAILSDPDPATRSRVATLLGEIGSPDSSRACETGLKDRDHGVRWAAVLAAMNCGIRPARLPPFVAARERTGPDPVAAAILNFLFLGIGYNYIGRWWGFPVFMTYMCVLVLAQIKFGPLLPYLIAYPITALLGIHTYFIARRMSDL